MEERFCYIFAAAALEEGIPFAPQRGKDLVIAADAGYKHLQKLGREPDILIGDFDSLRELPKDVARLRYPSRKDDTDLMLAVNYGFDHGFDRFIVYGGMGGKLDFTLANFQILSSIVNRGGSAYFTGEGSLVTAVKDGALLFDEQFTGRVSVFCCGGAARDVTLRGLQYPLHNALLTYDNPLGVSNAFTGTAGCISCGEGILAVIYDAVNNRMKMVKNTEMQH